MKTFLLVLGLVIGFWYTSLGQCTNSVVLSGSDGECKISICEINNTDYFIITQRLSFASNREDIKKYRTHIKEGTPLIFVDDHNTIHKLKLHGYEYNSTTHKNEDIADCDYYYVVFPQLLNYLLLHPVELLFMYRDDRTEMYTLTKEQQLKLYNIVREFYEYKGWKLKID